MLSRQDDFPRQVAAIPNQERPCGHGLVGRRSSLLRLASALALYVSDRVGTATDHGMLVRRGPRLFLGVSTGHSLPGMCICKVPDPFAGH
jgi:hypothetical protein